MKTMKLAAVDKNGRQYEEEIVFRCEGIIMERSSNGILCFLRKMTKSGLCLLGLIWILHPVLLSQQQDYTDLIKDFRSASVPVESIELQADFVLVKLQYRDYSEFIPGLAQKDILRIAPKLADVFTSSAGVILSIYDSEELLYELSYRTRDAIRYSIGGLEEEEFLSLMGVKDYSSEEDTHVSPIPYEPDKEVPIVVIPVPGGAEVVPQPIGQEEKPVVETPPEKVAEPEVIFWDDFDLENGSRDKLTHRQLSNWDVALGAVDLIGSRLQESYPGQGLFLDLDGPASQAATIQTNTVIKLDPDTYILEFELAGCRNGRERSVNVSLGGFFSESITIQGNAPFKKIQRQFIVDESSNVIIVFWQREEGETGLLLDNVKLSGLRGAPLPEPIKEPPPEVPQKSQDQVSYLGVQFREQESGGVKIFGVVEDSPAHHAGLQIGDLILEMGEFSFRDGRHTDAEISNIISELPVDRPIRFHISRNTKTFDVWVKLEKIYIR